MAQNLKKIIKVLLPIGLFFLVIFVACKTAHAQSYLGEGWDKYLGGLKTFAGAGTKTGEELATAFIKNGIRIVRYLVGAVAVLMGILYGFLLITARGREDVIAKQKQNFLWVLMGFVILIISENVADIFNPETATTEKIIDFGAARDQLRDIVDYLKWLLGSVIVLMMTVSGIRMITASGDEETITKQKRNLTWSMIGMLVILLANNAVDAVYIVRSPKEITAGRPESAITEIIGVIQLILVFLGPLAIIFTIYAGFVYLTSFDNDERNQKAKRMIVGGITGIVVIYSAYAIINTIVQEPLVEEPVVRFLTTFIT